MRFVSLICVTLGLSGGVWAVPPLHTLLFAGVTGIAEADQRAIARQLGDWRVAPDGKSLVDVNCGAFPLESRTLELAANAAPAVLFVWGNACTSGHTGSSVLLYVKGAKGYTQQLGFPGADVEVLPTRTRQYADLRVVGASDCQAVWAWNGRAYDFKCSTETRRGACRAIGGNAARLCKR